MFSGSRQRLGLTRANTAITVARVDTLDRAGKHSFVKYFCSSPSFVLDITFAEASLDTFHQGE